MPESTPTPTPHGMGEKVYGSLLILGWQKTNLLKSSIMSHNAMH